MGLEPRREVRNKDMHFKVIRQTENETKDMDAFPDRKSEEEKGKKKTSGILTLSEKLVCFGEIYQIYKKCHHSMMLYCLQIFNKFFPICCQLIFILHYYPNMSFLTLSIVYCILVFLWFSFTYVK